MTTRGIRGAIDVAQDSEEEILAAARELLRRMVAENEGLEPDSIAAVLFTMTPDLTAAFPALAARQLGWVETALVCYQEIPVPNSLPRVLRILILWNTDRSQRAIRHVYLGRATGLRPDLRIERALQLAQ